MGLGICAAWMSDFHWTCAAWVRDFHGTIVDANVILFDSEMVPMQKWIIGLGTWIIVDATVTDRTWIDGFFVDAIVTDSNGI